MIKPTEVFEAAWHAVDRHNDWDRESPLELIQSAMQDMHREEIQHLLDTADTLKGFCVAENIRRIHLLGPQINEEALQEVIETQAPGSRENRSESHFRQEHEGNFTPPEGP